MSGKHITLYILAAFSLGLVGCATTTDGGSSGASGGQTARATLTPTWGNVVTGTVTFTQKGEKVAVLARVSGLQPGKHGFHIHEIGECNSPDGMSAGGHFNPGGKPHGAPGKPDRHAGDLPMLEVDPSGMITLRAEVDGLSVGTGLPNDVVGKSVVVHKDPDDYKTQPAGNSGARQSCAVIKKA